MRTSLISSLVLCAALAAITIHQGRRILDLEAQTDESINAGPLQRGETVPDLRVRDRGGHAKTFVFDGSREKPLLIYVVRPSCVWCARNTDAINSLLAQISVRFETIGLSLDRSDLDQYLVQHALSLETFTDPSPEIVAAYKLGPTPETIVVSPHGIVLRSWTGAFGSTVRPSLERFFLARLPIASGSDFE
ncbi:MAG: redoxin domain-containing protein [Acidobacteriia bacterium]|nr:redoxin domain-containing protein [Terriglobia bacterium]